MKQFLAVARKKSVAARKNLAIDAETAYQAVTSVGRDLRRLNFGKQQC